MRGFCTTRHHKFIWWSSSQLCTSQTTRNLGPLSLCLSHWKVLKFESNFDKCYVRAAWFCAHEFAISFLFHKVHPNWEKWTRLEVVTGAPRFVWIPARNDARFFSFEYYVYVLHVFFHCGWCSPWKMLCRSPWAWRACGLRAGRWRWIRPRSCPSCRLLRQKYWRRTLRRSRRRGSRTSCRRLWTWRGPCAEPCAPGAASETWAGEKDFAGFSLVHVCRILTCTLWNVSQRTTDHSVVTAKK